MADADAVVEPGERNVHLLREALAGIAIGPMPSAGSFLPGSGVSVMTAYGKVPLGLINGNTYREGLRPPFRPGAIIDAMREFIRRPEVTHGT